MTTARLADLGAWVGHFDGYFPYLFHVPLSAAHSAARCPGGLGPHVRVGVELPLATVSALDGAPSEQVVLSHEARPEIGAYRQWLAEEVGIKTAIKPDAIVKKAHTL